MTDDHRHAMQDDGIIRDNVAMSEADLDRFVRELQSVAAIWRDKGAGRILAQAGQVITALRNQLAEARAVVEARNAEIAGLLAEVMRWRQDSIKANEDALKAELEAGAAEAEVARLTAALEAERANGERLAEALEAAGECLDGEPEYHQQGMGCGLEDRNITDRYDAMEHGWECALERAYAEHVVPAREALSEALAAHRALAERGR